MWTLGGITHNKVISKENIFKPQLITPLDELSKKRFEEHLSSDKETQITIFQPHNFTNNLHCCCFYGNFRLPNKNIR